MACHLECLKESLKWLVQSCLEYLFLQLQGCLKVVKISRSVISLYQDLLVNDISWEILGYWVLKATVSSWKIYSLWWSDPEKHLLAEGSLIMMY